MKNQPCTYSLFKFLELSFTIKSEKVPLILRESARRSFNNTMCKLNGNMFKQNVW